MHVVNCFFCNKARTLLTSWGRGESVVRLRGCLAPRQPLSVCALLPAPREEQASTASWEPRPSFEVAEMDWLAALRAWKASANQCPATSVAGSAAANQRPSRPSVREMLMSKRRWCHNGYKSNAWRHPRGTWGLAAGLNTCVWDCWALCGLPGDGFPGSKWRFNR